MKITVGFSSSSRLSISIVFAQVILRTEVSRDFLIFSAKQEIMQLRVLEADISMILDVTY
jgi:hypothetical protein